MQEIFADYHGYKVGNLGTIIGPKGKPLSPSVTPKGYHKVVLVYNHRKHTVRVHRLVAMMFCRNPYPRLYTQVNHTDGSKANNAASNLEWCCCAQNIQAKYDLRRLKGLPILTDAERKGIERAWAARRKKVA